MKLPVARAVTMALAFALAGCSSTPAQTLPTEPVETDSPATLTPVVTPAAEPTATASSTEGSSADNGNGWPVTVTATIAGTTTDSDGTYSATGPARLCGNPLASIDPTAHLFSFEFPLDGTFNPRDIAFGAEDLLPGTTTSLFNIGVTIVNSAGHEPPATVITPDLPDRGDTGTATLTEADGKRTVTLQAAGYYGETIQLTAVCGPAPA